MIKHKYRIAHHVLPAQYPGVILYLEAGPEPLYPRPGQERIGPVQWIWLGRVLCVLNLAVAVKPTPPTVEQAYHFFHRVFQDLVGDIQIKQLQSALCDVDVIFADESPLRSGKPLGIQIVPGIRALIYHLQIHPEG